MKIQIPKEIDINGSFILQALVFLFSVYVLVAIIAAIIRG